MIKQEWDAEESPKANKKEHFRIIKTPRQQAETYNNPYEQLYSANPILPPGVYRDSHDKYLLKIRQNAERLSKMNKTSFPEVKARHWLNQTQTNISMSNTNNLPHLIHQQEDQYQQCEFKDQIANKIMVYCRINNKKYNKIDKDQPRIFCSLFLNSKKQQIKSRKTPIFQYLPKIYKDMPKIDCFEDVLNFNSAFESGNLFCAFKCPLEPMTTYELYMQNDTNTKGCTQWFYFSVWAQRRLKFKIRIMNFYKPTSLYMQGMKILTSIDQVQWKRVGTAIKYNRVSLASGKDSYCLEFIYQIQTPQKEYFFSYGFPYTFTHLQNILYHFSQTPLYPRIVLKSNLCQSYLGNNVTMFTITNNIKNKIQKPIIYIIARQHPGETPGSLIVEGLIKSLLSSRVEMDQLRDNFIFKVVPMINIDGVINGNYRSNLSGNDVNRQWLGPSRKLHPEIFYLKQQILTNKKYVHFFLDIHAHSRKMNSFFYGSKSFSFQNRLYPFVCSKLNKNISFQQCSFTDDASKKTTARVVLQNQGGIKKSLTFEASFYGSQDAGKKTKTHFKQEDLKSLGQSLAIGLYYSQIGLVKHAGKNQVQQNKIKKQEQIQNARNSVSCHLGAQNKKQKKSQIYAKIQKNCVRIMQKWKKQVDRFTHNQDAISEGSSLDPQHFQLTQFQQEFVANLSHKHQTIQKDKGNINPEQRQQLNDQQVLVLPRNQKQMSAKSSSQLQQLNQSQPKEELKSTRYSIFPIQSNLRNSLVVKKLQHQLQMRKTHRRYQSLNGDKQKQSLEAKKIKFANEIVRGQKFNSLDLQTNEANTYRNNIIQMKKALKYFMQNKSYDYKSTDYDDYKNYVKYAANGGSVVMPDKDSVSRIKRKYMRI